MKFSGIKSLRFLLIVNLIFGAALLRTVRQYNDFVHSSEEKEKEKVVALTKKAAQELGAIVAHVEERTKKMAAAFSKNSTPPVSDIKKQLAAELDSNEIFLGSGVLYAPYAYSKKIYLFGPYLHRSGKSYEFTDAGMVYDYTADTKKSKFFYNAFSQNQTAWSEPFWGEASKKLVVTYSVPFYVNGDIEKPSGIIVNSISIDEIYNILSSL
ncbi:hypothetical protein GCAAIG_03510 [Candidatus Electronema halotolerans]